jgi:HK97 family phage prohead protease
MRNKQFAVTVEKLAQTGDYDARFIMSSSSPDRDRDVITPQALRQVQDTKLIALWQHNPSNPIGFWENLRLEAGKLIGDLKVASTELGMMVKQLLAENVPLAASIGFMGAGPPNKAGGIDFHEIELMECSLVSVPSNRDAQRIAKQFGFDLSREGEPLGKSAHQPASQDAISRARRAVMNANLTMRKKP